MHLTLEFHPITWESNRPLFESQILRRSLWLYGQQSIKDKNQFYHFRRILLILAGLDLAQNVEGCKQHRDKITVKFDQ